MSAIGVEELLYCATVLGGETVHYFEFMTVTAAIYFCLIVPLSALVQRKSDDCKVYQLDLVGMFRTQVYKNIQKSIIN